MRHSRRYINNMGHGLANLYSKRILIRVDGSHKIGLGHIYRMKTLALSLLKAGCEVAFISQSDSTATQLLQSTGLKTYWLNSYFYNTVLQEAILDHQPNLIVQDILETDIKGMTELRGMTSAKIINFDDVGAGLIFADVVINSIVFHWGGYKADESQARLFEGPQYMIMNPVIVNYASRSKKILKQAKRILLAFGGTDTHFVMGRVLHIINRLDASLSITINLGPGSDSPFDLDKIIRDSPHQIRILRAVPNLFGEFFEADLVICAGGIMLYELAAMGIPSIAIPTEPHEIDNVTYWAEVGTTLGLSYEKKLDPLQVAEIVLGILPDCQRRVEMSSIGKRAIDAFGLDRVMNIIDEVLS